MARNKSRIGFDPLAWMKGSAPKAQDEPTRIVPAARVTAGAKPSPAPAAGGTAVIHLGEELTIRDVSARHQEWKQALAGARQLELDGARLAHVDTAGLQLLAALVREAKRGGINARWRAAHDGVREAAGRLGLAVCLSLT